MRLMIACPATDEPVPTGIKIERSAFRLVGTISPTIESSLRPAAPDSGIREDNGFWEGSARTSGAGWRGLEPIWLTDSGGRGAAPERY
jgi:hypothetical protein